MPFNDIVGHKTPIRILRSMIQTGKIPHAFIFFGVAGIGKRTTAVSFVKAVNCMELDDDFCGTCVSCQKVERGVHPDFFCVEPEKKVIKIEQIRTVQQDVSIRAIEGKKKVVIIDQAEKLNPHAANCLLKTLEEPPENTVIILIAQSTAEILATVLSRCQRIGFSPLNDEEMMFCLSAQGVDEERATLVTHIAQGSISRALFLLDSDFTAKRRQIAEMLSQGSCLHLDSMFDLSKELSVRGEEFPLILEFLKAWYRDVLLLKEGVSPDTLYNCDIVSFMESCAMNETREGIIKKLKQVQWMERNVISNIDVQLGMETVFLGN